MNARERFHAVMEFGQPDRLPLWEFMGFWPETVDRWHKEGLPANVQNKDYYLGGRRLDTGNSTIGLKEYFGFDRVESVPLDFNFVPPFKRIVIEEDEQTQVVRDECGLTKKVFKNGSAMPHFIDFPIKSRQDFLEIKERLEPTSSERYPADWDELVRASSERDYPLYLICRGPFAFCRDFMKFDQFMMVTATDGEWIREMMAFQVDFMIGLWERALSDLEIDFVYIGEDMAYKMGPMISPAMGRDLLLPLYKKLTEFLRAHGVRHIIVDSDGDIRSMIPVLLEGGVTGILPIERTEGCDPVELRKQYPRLRMIGGLDKKIIAQGGEAMQNEVREHVGPLAASGGYIPGYDHSVHPLTSFDIYCEYLSELKGQIANA